MVEDKENESDINPQDAIGIEKRRKEDGITKTIVLRENKPKKIAGEKFIAVKLKRNDVSEGPSPEADSTTLALVDPYAKELVPFLKEGKSIG